MDLAYPRVFRLSHFWAWLRKWWHEEWASVLFTVCLVTLLHHAQWLGPLSNLSLVIVSNFDTAREQRITAVTPQDAHAVIIAINADEFDERFGERSPLDRCLLADDLQSLVKLKPAVLAIDLDLSPLARPTTAELECQKNLNTLLDSGVQAGPQFVTALPARPAPGWQRERQRNGVRFADTTLELSLNVAMDTECRTTRLAEMVFAASSAVAPCAAEHRVERHPINYAAFLDLVKVNDIEYLRTSTPALPAGKVLFYGGMYGDDDRYLTPIGKRYGVEVHAARFATLQKPVGHEPILAFVIDLAIGFAFSLWVTRCVQWYADNATSPSRMRRHRRTGTMLLFLVGYAVAAATALWLALILFRHGVVVEPVLIAFALAVDGFVVAPWRHISHATAHETELVVRLSSLQRQFGRDFRGTFWFVADKLVFWLVVAAVVWVFA